jgi:photosynthetic reaction center H subunit
MQTGAITSYIDVAQLTLYAFWIFFAGLIFYLRREDKREGYPLESDRSRNVRVVGFPPMPSPKVFMLPHGGTRSAPRVEAPSGPIAAEPVGAWPGAPLQPTGDPLRDGVGPASYGERADLPDLTLEGEPKIVPLRRAPDFFLEPRDPDPRGMAVIGGDRQVAGTVQDIWIDRSEAVIRYLEVAVTTPEGVRSVLAPMPLARVNGARGEVVVRSILAADFVEVPGLRDPDQVTLREEDRIVGYYGGGQLYAVPSRLGPIL